MISRTIDTVKVEDNPPWERVIDHRCLFGWCYMHKISYHNPQTEDFITQKEYDFWVTMTNFNKKVEDARKEMLESCAELRREVEAMQGSAPEYTRKNDNDIVVSNVGEGLENLNWEEIRGFVNSGLPRMRGSVPLKK